MVVLKRDNKGKLEIFEVPESVLPESELQKYKIFSASNGEDSYKEAIEIYKMEYERCAQRYNDLYNAAWTNFSYMALVAGGLLTFGGARFGTALTVLLACLPLLFWWIATFEPLNRYGDGVLKELCHVEKALNALFISDDLPEEARKGLTHFQRFAEGGHGVLGRFHRVRYVVRVAAIILLLTSLGFGWKVRSLVMKGEPLTVKAEPLTVLVTTPTPTPTAKPTALPTSSPVLKSHSGRM